ncbi:hypothetical protein ACHAW5_002053 [Stephanodiscus triporus]|uniref:Uncharacterized protein n=1 Tax=Stephanodiscus triporus TaxID=2934178 RepID=A0ABD3PFN2_9STRA
MSIPVPVLLKWGKASYNDGQITIIPGSSARDLKLQVNPSPAFWHAWRGALNDDDFVPHHLAVVPHGKRGEKFSGTLVVTHPKAEAENGNGNGDGDGDGHVMDIVALQMEAGIDRDDGRKEGNYEYNRLVTGLPQHHINDVLARRRRWRWRGRSRECSNEDVVDSEVGKGEEEDSTPPPLLGEVAMTMGAELCHAYVNSINVLRDGTIVSGLNDGHVQLWRWGALIRDTRHEGFGGVDHDGHCIGPRFDAHPGTLPASIACSRMDNDGDDNREAVDGRGTTRYLAACFRVTLENEAERRRRDDTVAREWMIQNELIGALRVIKILVYDGRGWGSSDGALVRETAISFDSLEGTTASITHLFDVDSKLVSIRTSEWVGGRLLAMSIKPELDAGSSRILTDDEVKVVSVAKVMNQPGYVFDLKVLPDANGSNVFAIAAARYNLIKIMI